MIRVPTTVVKPTSTVTFMAVTASAQMTLVSQQPAYLAGGVLMCLAVVEVLVGLWPGVLTGLMES